MSKETIASMCRYATERIRAQIVRNILVAKREIAAHDIFYAREHEFPAEYIKKARKRSLKYLIPVCITHIIVRDRDHFYALVHWFNKNVGMGMHYWTVRASPTYNRGRKILKYVDPNNPAYDPPVTRAFLIYVPGIDVTPLLSL